MIVNSPLMTLFDDPFTTLLFWTVYVVGVYQINKIVERWPNKFVFVVVGFLFIAFWLAMLTVAMAYPVLSR